MSVEEIAREIPHLSIPERRQLLDVILDSLIDAQSRRTRSVLDFAAAGEWDGVDAQEYINQLRQEWENRP